MALTGRGFFRVSLGSFGRRMRPCHGPGASFRWYATRVPTASGSPWGFLCPSVRRRGLLSLQLDEGVPQQGRSG